MYVTLFLTNPHPCHTSSHIRDPQSTSYTSDLPFLVGLIHNTRTKKPLYKFPLNCSLRFCPGVLSGVIVWGPFLWKVLSGIVLVRSPFCQNTSVTTVS